MALTDLPSRHLKADWTHPQVDWTSSCCQYTLAQATQKSRTAAFHGSGAIAPKRPLERYRHIVGRDLHTGRIFLQPSVAREDARGLEK